MDNLLIIDDDLAFAAVLARALARRGVASRHAASPSAALQALDPAPAGILLDLNLAGDSGLALLPALKARCPASCIVVLTGFASIATAVEAVKLGATQYLAKPADADAILAAFGQQEPDPDLPVAAQPMSVKRLTWEHVQRVLAEHEGNVSATARALNMHRRTLQRMLSKKPVAR